MGSSSTLFYNLNKMFFPRIDWPAFLSTKFKASVKLSLRTKGLKVGVMLDPTTPPGIQTSAPEL